jgi:hypothetical protein
MLRLCPTHHFGSRLRFMVLTLGGFIDLILEFADTLIPASEARATVPLTPIAIPSGIASYFCGDHPLDAANLQNLHQTVSDCG